MSPHGETIAATRRAETRLNAPVVPAASHEVTSTMAAAMTPFAIPAVTSSRRPYPSVMQP